ncbi:MAG: hypothetical protein JXA89_02045 [Anaerolineae bacterium]|nr:hypothetical protein [Anaerolineae bacterium]
MHRKKPKDPRQQPAFVPEPRRDPIVLETEIAEFVLHPDDQPALKYRLFYPDGDRSFAPKSGGDGPEIDQREQQRRRRRFGELWLAYEESGFTADLYLDRDLVSEDKVGRLCEGVYDFLNRLSIGPEGGSLAVYWMQEIALYDFPPGT